MDQTERFGDGWPELRQLAYLSESLAEYHPCSDLMYC